MSDRILKFRAWDKLAKRFITPETQNQNHYVLSLDGKFQNFQDGSGGEEYVVQQFTGLFDKNGKEIFEGDILSWYHGVTDTGEVKFSGAENNFGSYPDICFYGVHIERLFGLCIFQMDDEYEVIGNIFENPELIKNV